MPELGVKHYFAWSTNSVNFLIFIVNIMIIPDSFHLMAFIMRSNMQ